MNTNLVVSLDTRRQKQDGTYPLVLRLGHNGKTTALPLDVDLHEKDWNEAKRLVKAGYGTSETVKRLNNRIAARKAEAMAIILKLHETGQLQSLSVTDVKQRLGQQDSSQSFYAFADGIIKELVTAGRIGTAKSYSAVLSIVKAYWGKKDLRFQEITFTFLNKFEAAHYAKGNTANGLAVYMRTIRAIYNKAIKSGLADKDAYPFEGYQIKTAPTEKRALDMEPLKAILTLRLSPGQKGFHARNFFVASYMMYGMNFTDMAHLKKTDLEGGRIRYRRRKTGKLYDIKITPALQEILSYYIDLTPGSPFVFPIIKRKTPVEQHKDIQWASKSYSVRLKELARQCGIEGNMTPYVSRHSFATQAMMQDVPLSAISAMLGHSSLKTTEVYLKSLPTNILDDYNARLMLD